MCSESGKKLKISFFKFYVTNETRKTKVRLIAKRRNKHSTLYPFTRKIFKLRCLGQRFLKRKI